MKKGRLQCKDIDTRGILELLAKRPGTWHVPWPSWPTDMMPSIVPAFPEGTVDKLRRAKMSQLIRHGLVDGCACGCRGDFEITEKGLEWLARQSSVST